ncbi:uncharacterized protein [Drosophila kikkawai]|uniref:Uncharacterized protein n=1 Tax=Drosophila kikkawai TaxID=30033 RepID=A0ABM4GI06_DROKI
MESWLKEVNGEMFLKIFEERNFTINGVKCLTWEQLRGEIPTELVGAAVVFFNNLKQLKQNDEASIAPQPGTENFHPSTPTSGIEIGTIIAQSQKGKLILNNFRMLKTLNGRTRKELSRVIIEYFLARKIQPKQNLLEDVSNQIVQLFPSETTETYFIKNKGKKPGGLLYSHFYNLKAKFCAREKISENVENLPPNSYADEGKADVGRTWLKLNVEPFDAVLKYWQLTFQWRTSFLKSETNLSTILEELPILYESFGYVLIEDDFNRLYPRQANNFIDRWDDFKRKIVPLLKSKINEQQSLNLLKDFERQSEESQEIIVWMSIHAVLIPTTRTKKTEFGRIAAKHTIADSRAKFIVWKNTLAELKTFIKEQTEDCYSERTKLQPFVCCIGTDVLHFTDFFVYMSGIFYRLPSLKKSIDICFKLFFVLNLEYQTECQLVWAFIQKQIFEIDLKTDPKNKALFELLNDFKNLDYTNI